MKISQRYGHSVHLVLGEIDQPRRLCLSLAFDVLPMDLTFDH